MKAIKRLDIVVDHAHTGRLVRVLEQFGVSGYTVMPGSQGKGNRGMQHADGLMTAASNDVVFTTCSPEELEDLCAAVRPMLKRFGGVCLISDAHWLEH